MGAIVGCGCGPYELIGALSGRGGGGGGGDGGATWGALRRNPVEQWLHW